MSAAGRDPIEVAAALRGRGPLVLLDGGLDADGLGRWSHLACDPVGAIFAWGERLLHVERDGRRWRERGAPLAALGRRVQALGERVPAAVSPAGDPRPLVAGAIGLLGYELGRVLERLPRPGDDRGMLPDLAFWLFEDVLGYDHETGSWWGGGERARAALARAPALGPPPPPAGGRSIVADFTQRSYIQAVERVREHILEGDVYQVNLSQRFRGVLAEEPFDLYRRLRRRRPAPLGAYLEAGGKAVLSNSPELFLRRRGLAVETRPIKGTRRRGAGAAEDRRLAAELLASAKDAAELTMIVDLMRNDLGRVARPGTVSVPGLRRLVSLPTVHHTVATVEARLGAEVGSEVLLAATFPPGSVTGCPKIRAMELIAALEPCRRGAYTGAIGWLAPGGDLTLSVAIRTLTAARGSFSFHSGGGVVIDSDPLAEYEETLAKGRAFFEALGVDERLLAG